MPTGPGAGPEALGTEVDDLGEQIRALYSAYPNPHLRELIEKYEKGYDL